MTKFKTVIVAVAIVAFLGYCVWLSPNLFGNRIKGEMVADSLLKYDQGAGVYLASKDDNSKVFFGQSGKYRFYGTGALTLKASPKEGTTSFGSGFNLLIEGGNLELKAGQADILTGSVSSSGQFLALMNINGILSIFEITSGNQTYESKENFVHYNPIGRSTVEFPGFYWTDQGLIVQKYKDSAMVDSGSEIIGTYDMTTNTWASNKDIVPMIVSIEPTTGNENEIPIENKEIELRNIFGTIDSDNLLITFSSSNKDISNDIGKLNLSTSEIIKMENIQFPTIGFHDNAAFFLKDHTLVYSKITAKSASAPIAVKLPELDGEQLTPELIENLRVTSKGYLHFRHIKTAKTYLLDPISGVYVEIPKERYPY